MLTKCRRRLQKILVFLVRNVRILEMFVLICFVLILTIMMVSTGKMTFVGNSHILVTMDIPYDYGDSDLSLLRNIRQIPKPKPRRGSAPGMPQEEGRPFALPYNCKGPCDSDPNYETYGFGRGPVSLTNVNSRFTQNAAANPKAGAAVLSIRLPVKRTQVPVSSTSAPRPVSATPVQPENATTTNTSTVVNLSNADPKTAAALKNLFNWS